MPYGYDLGAYKWKVSTDVPEAQEWFNRGMAWTYGFNHEEAVACFRRAAEADPSLAMAQWGIAYAIGPNYNKQWDAFDEIEAATVLEAAHSAARRALTLSENCTDLERSLIDAIQKRYQEASPLPDMSSWNDDYSDAMRTVYGNHPGHPDIEALFAEAMMNRTPWALWEVRTGDIPDGADTAEAQAVLEGALARIERERGEPHPGILHMYIHLMEMSQTPERALAASDRLRDLVPDSGHLQHMPTHIDVLSGDYAAVVRSNSDAIEADMLFLEREGPINFYSLYRSHNFHFKVYGAMFLGQYSAALEAAEAMNGTLPEEVLRTETPPMADWLEGFVAIKQHVLVRFGKWNEIIAQDLPADQTLYCATTTTMHYARAIAFASLGQTSAALKEADAFERAYASIPETRYLFNNSCRDILAIGREMMLGEILYRKGEHDEAFARLRAAVHLDDNLVYDEPWAWMQPVRHALGALLLEQDRVEEAMEVYRADLGYDGTLSRSCQHPDNLWSLAGYHECLERLGLTEQATIIGQKFKIASARADVPVKSSCFCRLSAA